MTKSNFALKFISFIVAGVSLLMAPGTIFAQTPTEDADSLTLALATIYGNFTDFLGPDRAAALSQEQLEQFAQGVSAALVDNASNTNLFALGCIYGTGISKAVNQMNDIGLSIDGNLLADALVKVIKGENVGYTPESAEKYITDYFLADYNHDPADFTPAVQAEFIAKAMKEEGAITTPSGLVFRIIREGEGDFPTDNDRVELNYIGRLSDGTVFDQTDSPVNFNLQNLVEGLSEGLKMMRPGGIYHIVIPASIGYGEKGIEGAIPGGAALDFTIELLGVERGANNK